MLVVDDDELRSLISLAVADAGYSPVEAADAGCDSADLAMPRLGGQAFADAYRRGQCRAKITVTSGATSGGEASARMGAAMFLSKPHGLDELVRVVNRVLHSATA